jgi:hypothetical protein
MAMSNAGARRIHVKIQIEPPFDNGHMIMNITMCGATGTPIIRLHLYLKFYAIWLAV